MADSNQKSLVCNEIMNMNDVLQEINKSDLVNYVKL